jgi:hypothetical protein
LRLDLRQLHLRGLKLRRLGLRKLGQRILLGSQYTWWVTAERRCRTLSQCAAESCQDRQSSQERENQEVRATTCHGLSVSVLSFSLSVSCV